MRIAEITAEPVLHGGQEQFIKNLIDNVHDHQTRIDVITPYICDNEDFQKSVEEKGGRVIALGLPFLRGRSRKLLYEPVKSLLKRELYDAVHIHSGSISALAYIAKAASEAGIKKIIVHSHSTAVQSLKHSLVRTVYGCFLAKYPTDYLACSEEAGIDKFPARIVKNRLVIIKNGISIKKYRRDETLRKTQRKILGIPDDAFVIGHVGRFAFEKNHKFLADLFEEYHKECPESILLLVGDGELKEDITKRIKEKDIKETVVFTGNVDNVQDYYQAMDVFVFPSLYEGFSYVTLEAQAAGLPCIISTGVPDAVMIGKNIVKVGLTDKQQWLAAIRSAREKGVTDNTEAIIAAGFDANETAKSVIEIYKRGR